MTRAELIKLFVKFRCECIWLRNCFNMHSILFDSGPETDQLLKKVAHTFFYDLSCILQEYGFQRVAVLTDPPRTLGKANLSIAAMNEGLEEHGLLTPAIVDLSKALDAYRALIIDARNKLISHIDQKTVLLHDRSLGAHKPEDVAAFFENLQRYCDEVGNAVGEGPLDFRTIPGEGDVIDFLQHLKQSIG